MINKPFAESCEQNREPILQVLQQFVRGRQTVLEIGSGTGQHAVYFAQAFPFLDWQTSELSEHHAGIQAWIDDCGLDNVHAPLELDVTENWPGRQYDLVFTANTLHIMSEKEVSGLFDKLPSVMNADAVFVVYGPFNYGGQYTSASNANFDQWLKQRDPNSGIKNFEWLQDLATASGLECSHDFAMPANNRILCWQIS